MTKKRTKLRPPKPPNILYANKKYNFYINYDLTSKGYRKTLIEFGSKKAAENYVKKKKFSSAFIVTVPSGYGSIKTNLWIYYLR